MPDPILNKEQYENLRLVYQELCNSYRAIDEFRTKLLGLLPLATGAGIFLLVGDNDAAQLLTLYSGAIGTFGIAVTFGLFCFELFGIKKCTQLINDGKAIEKIISIQAEDDKKKKLGQFDRRPDGVAGFINEPFAAGIIYPAVLAAWTYIALFEEPVPGCVKFWTVGVFVVFFGITFFYTLYLKGGAK